VFADSRNSSPAPSFPATTGLRSRPAGCFENHLGQIRTFTGWRFATPADKQELEERLRRDDAAIAIISEKLLEAACRRFREQNNEFPPEPELLRIVNASLNGYSKICMKA